MSKRAAIGSAVDHCGAPLGRHSHVHMHGAAETVRSACTWPRVPAVPTDTGVIDWL